MSTSMSPADEADATPADFFDRPSKTQRKKQSHELQGLGEALVALSDAKLAALPMPELVLDALRDYKRTKTHEGKRRQMQYIGKLMRRIDAAPLQEAVAASQLGRATDALALHQAERWRAELLADDDAVRRWRTEHPDTDLQQLRSLVRSAPQGRRGRTRAAQRQGVPGAVPLRARGRGTRHDRWDRPRIRRRRR